MSIYCGSVKINNGETLFFRKAGDGEKVILFIHGNMSSSKHWEPLLHNLPGGYTAYAVDLRGFGESTYHQPIDLLDDFKEDLVLFADHFNLSNITVVGWSTGGGVAMLMAAEHPELVKNLVLIETVSYKGYPIFRKDEKGQPIIGEYYNSKEEMAADPVQVAPVDQAFREGNISFIKYLWDQLIYTVNKPPDDQYSSNLAATMQQRNLIDVDWALASFNISHEHNGVSDGNGLIDKINCPVLAFWGTRDLVVSREMVEETVAAIGDNARLVILENSGHSPITDAKDKLITEIFNFVG